VKTTNTMIEHVILHFRPLIRNAKMLEKYITCWPLVIIICYVILNHRDGSVLNN